MVFNFAAANCDDHAKNYGFLMDDTGIWSLAPAYDVIQAYNPEGQWARQHLMGVNEKFLAPTLGELIKFSERHRVPGAAAIIDEVNDAIESWPDFAAQAGLSVEHTAKVGRDHAPIVKW